MKIRLEVRLIKVHLYPKNFDIRFVLSRWPVWVEGKRSVSVCLDRKSIESNDDQSMLLFLVEETVLDLAKKSLSSSIEFVELRCFFIVQVEFRSDRRSRSDRWIYSAPKNFLVLVWFAMSTDPIARCLSLSSNSSRRTTIILIVSISSSTRSICSIIRFGERSLHLRSVVILVLSEKCRTSARLDRINQLNSMEQREVRSCPIVSFDRHFTFLVFGQSSSSESTRGRTRSLSLIQVWTVDQVEQDSTVRRRRQPNQVQSIVDRLHSRSARRRNRKERAVRWANPFLSSIPYRNGRSQRFFRQFELSCSMIHVRWSTEILCSEKKFVNLIDRIPLVDFRFHQCLYSNHLDLIRLTDKPSTRSFTLIRFYLSETSLTAVVAWVYQFPWSEWNSRRALSDKLKNICKSTDGWASIWRESSTEWTSTVVIVENSIEIVVEAFLVAINFSFTVSSVDELRFDGRCTDRRLRSSLVEQSLFVGNRFVRMLNVRM